MSGAAALDPVVARPGRMPLWLRPRAAWLAVPGLLFLALFFILPVIQLFGVSVRDPQTLEFSFAGYRRALGATVYLRVLQNTFVIAAQTTALCILFGYPLAYWLAGLTARVRSRLILLVMLPFWTSALVKAFAWLVLLARYGVVARVLGAISPTGQAPDLLHGRGAVLMGMTHTLLPLAVLTMLPVMLRIDRGLISAAGTLGAARLQGFWRVFFHLSMPGVAAAALLCFIASLGFFITPALLGGRRDAMIGQVIIEQIQAVLDWQFGGALAAMLVGSALLTCLVYDRVFGLSVVAGDGGERAAGDWLRRIGLAVLAGCGNGFTWISEAAARVLRGHRFGWVLPCYAVLLIGFLMIPTLLILPMAFTSSRFLEFPPPGFGLHWMEVYFGSPLWMSATLRSFAVAAATAPLAALIAGAAALAVARSGPRWGRLVFAVFLGPIIVPTIVTAVAQFYLFARLSLVATTLGLVIGHTVIALPICFVAMVAVLKGHDWRLDQAAATLGASRLRVLRHVTVPLIKGGCLAALLFAFITSFEELTVALFISGGLKTTLPKQMWDDVLMAVNPTLAAASVIVLAVVFALFLIAERLRPPSTQAGRL
ncbi:MAG: ABC transporter permease subunit [Acetobacteraceae bacterium]